MSHIGKPDRELRLRGDLLETAPGFILEYGVEGPWIDRMARHLGISPRTVTTVFETKAKLVGFILSRHLADAFEAVCLPADWSGPKVDVLRSMSVALIAYEVDHLERHRMFLAEYERGADAMRRSLAEQLTYLTNNFQVALHAVRPKMRFKTLNNAASILLGQLLHAPLWWPKETSPAKARSGRPSSTLLDAWVCTQIGLSAGIRRPAHRRPSAATLKRPEAFQPALPTCEEWRPALRPPSSGGEAPAPMQPEAFESLSAVLAPV